MTAGSHGARGVPGPAGPALAVRVMIRPMTKIPNPVIVKLAGRRHFPFAVQIRHAGRRTGKAYLTPATDQVHGDVIVIALTFGNQSGWSRHVRAAGGCLIRENGHDYRAASPQVLRREGAADLIRPAFNPPERAGFPLPGIRQFMRLDALPARP
jgi:deazaflavin-dependent oxidoreductase (nitroreductase family)